MNKRVTLKARLISAIPVQRVDLTLGDGESLPQAGDVVELDHGFSGPDGTSMGIVVCRNTDGSVRWVGDALESEIKLLSQFQSGIQLPLRCPCCEYKTIDERGVYLICPVCFWEDDGQDDNEADEIWGGPNGRLSLSQARANFKAFGVSDERHKASVRPPLPDEL